jgi:hypothetical protein
VRSLGHISSRKIQTDPHADQRLLESLGLGQQPVLALVSGDTCLIERPQDDRNGTICNATSTPGLMEVSYE